jgi:hypothetical protein
MIPVTDNVQGAPTPRRRDLQALALALAALSSWLIHRHALWALLGFALSGLALAGARRGPGGIVDDLIPAVRARQSWEPWFLALLLGLGALSFAWRLGSIPEGANYSEGMLMVRSMTLAAQNNYVANDDGEISWPTLYHYQGALAAKFLGYTPTAYRLVSVVWAMLALVVFYFTVRLLFTPESAAVASLLWLAFHFNIHFARRYSPLVFLYIPPMLALACTILGLRRKQWWWFAGAGFAVGLAIHGYFPGRVMPVAFFALSVWLFFKRRSLGLDYRNILLAWLVFFVTAAPVINFAIRHPDVYNQYIKQWSNVSAEKAKETKGLAYVEVFRQQMKPYLLMFHVAGNSEYEEDDSYGRPVLDPVAGILFPLGFFFCVFYFWKGVPFYLLAVFWLGFLPGLYTKSGVPPFPRREILCFPAVFLMLALAVEELRLGLFYRLSVRRWLALGLLIGSGLLVREWRHYWIYTHSPGFRQFSNVACYYTGQEMRAHKDHRAVISESLLASSPSRPMLIPPDYPATGFSRAEETCVLPLGQDVLLVLGPYLEPVLPQLQKLYPNMDLKVYREKAYEDQAFLEQQMRDTIFQAFHADITNPSIILFRALIPAKDIEARNGWLFLSGDGSRVAPGDAGFVKAHAGAKLRLGTTVLADTPGQSVVARAPWPGWKAVIDGRPLALNKPTWIEGGLRFVELEGKVPAKADQALPFGFQNIHANGTPLGDKQLLAWRLDFGFRVDFLRGMGPDLDRPATYSGYWRFPAVRWNEDYKLVDYPARVRARATYVPAKSGLWEFRLAKPGGGNGRVTVDKKLVFVREGNGSLNSAAVELQAGKPVEFRVDYEMQLAVAQATAFLLQAKAPGSDHFEWMLGEEFKPLEGKPGRSK